MAASAKQRVEALRKEIEHHNHLYYVQARPAISDRAFDKLLQDLIDLEAAHPELASPNSPTRRVGGDVLESLRPVKHAVPMMSIDNTYSEAEVRTFDERVRRGLGAPTDGDAPAVVRYVLEPKIDGTAISLRYEKGELVLAATRGRGNVGDDITVNARTIRSVPLHLRDDKAAVPDVVEVRGEIYMDNADFQRVNKELAAEDEEPYANPRNLTAGTLRRLDPKIVAKRRLRFLAHGLGQVDPLPAKTYWEWLDLIRAWGLPVPKNIARVDGVDEALKVIKLFETDRRSLPYMTDGMVMKVDDFALREKLGATSKAPRWVIAYKYETEQQPTVLRDVRWQVGKGGNLTPVADLDPVFIGGVTVTHATLHNIDQIKRLDLHLGDTVILERAGEVIPYVVEARADKRPKDAHAVEAPKHCPACGADTEREADTPYIRCVNPACPAQLKERVRWFAGRSQMDIEDLGDVLVDQLVDRGLVKTFADLYRLMPEQLTELERVGEKSAKNIVANIAKSREQGLDRLLAGLGIPHVGNRVATVLAENFGSLDAIGRATQEDLVAVHEIGEVIADSVHDFFNNEAGREAIRDLKEVGVDPHMAIRKPEEAAALPLAGKSVVVTGTLAHFTRDAIELMIKKLGGKPSGSVSKKTSFLIAGESAGSKLEKAEQLGVPVKTEAAFLKEYGGDVPAGNPE